MFIWISLVLIYLINNVGMACAKVRLRCSYHITGINLFDHNVGMACAKVRLRCSWISLFLIYLIKIGNGI